MGLDIKATARPDAPSLFRSRHSFAQTLCSSGWAIHVLDTQLPAAIPSLDKVTARRTAV